jgi:dienelactone hydrolase
MKPLRLLLVLAAALLLLQAGGPWGQAQVASYSSEPGPFQAGWTQVTVSRPDGSTFGARLFYPAAARGSGATYSGNGAPYPAVSFGHGWLTSVDQYQSTLEHLATWGYFAVASESQSGLFPNHSDFANDLLYCLDYLRTNNGNAASWLNGQVNADAFGLSGHSMGGGASILAASRDSRIKALANMAAAETTPSAKDAMPSLRAPVRLIVGSADGTVSPSTTRAIYDNGQPPKQFANLQGGGHCGFTDTLTCDFGASMSRSTQQSITRRLLTEWFNLYLKGDQGPWRAVWGPEFDDDTRIVMTVNPGVTLSPSSATAETWNGAAASYAVEVKNTGTVAASYTLPAEGNTWPVTFAPSTTPSLAPGATAGVTVTVTALTGGTTGSDTALISARSSVDGGTRAYGWRTTTSINPR